jgi:hypothetical protein
MQVSYYQWFIYFNILIDKRMNSLSILHACYNVKISGVTFAMAFYHVVEWHIALS